VRGVAGLVGASRLVPRPASRYIAPMITTPTFAPRRRRSEPSARA